MIGTSMAFSIGTAFIIMTCCTGGDGIETSMTLYGLLAFIITTCCTGGETIGTSMIWCGENADIFLIGIFGVLK